MIKREGGVCRSSLDLSSTVDSNLVAEECVCVGGGGMQMLETAGVRPYLQKLICNANAFPNPLHLVKKKKKNPAINTNTKK